MRCCRQQECSLVCVLPSLALVLRTLQRAQPAMEAIPCCLGTGASRAGDAAKQRRKEKELCSRQLPHDILTMNALLPKAWMQKTYCKMQALEGFEHP